MRRDLYTSVAVVLREIRRHRPHFIYGMGQGGLVALSMAKPLLVETAMVARFFQEPEVTQVAEAWWAVKGCIVTSPRATKPSRGSKR